ncbi:hypothetical protein [Clostridium saccharoperbutylacetonicum]|uniref:hypothetical protein n=1 Tax=Clostridium saccharoperbutylacetonicum TaxID=36745 RepID=UPI0039E932FF
MAAIDFIKQYLIGIGFHIDEDSFNKANSSMDNAEDNIKKFNESNKKGFLESGDTLKNLFSLFNTFGQGVGKLTPELRTPFANMSKDIFSLMKLYAQFNEQFKKTTKQPDSEPIKTETNIPKNSTALQNTNLVEQALSVKDATKGLAEEGTANVAKFSVAAVAEFAVVATAVVAVVAGIAKLMSGIADLAKQDIENEKLSRQLWTTKENAKEVDMALKTMGASMQDLWFSPTLLKQFNQLRQDSKNLQLPPEFQQNLKIVQGLGLEFSRLKQLGSLAFQWIGNYILKYLAGPLNDARSSLKGFNDWLIKTIPGIAKVLGSALGIVLRMLATVGEVLGFIINGISKIISFIAEHIPKPLQNILKIIGLIGLAIMSGPVGAIVLLIAAIDDFITYLKGGKSLTGTFIDTIAKKFEYVQEKIKSVINFFKELKDEFLNTPLVKGIGNFVTEVKDFFKGDLKPFSKDMQLKADQFSNATIPNYAVSNSSNSNTTTSNSNNKVSQSNTFNVYGTGNANSAANTISSKVNNNGIFTRNLQGVIN